MKKITAFLVIFIFVGSALSAQIKPSAGFMALGDFSFGNGKISKSTMHSVTYQMPNFNFGVGAFFDGTYFEAFAHVTYGVLLFVKNDHNESVAGAQKDTGGWRDATLHGYALEFGFGVLGKYPIELGEAFTLFPMFGLNYNSFMYTINLVKPAAESVIKTFGQFGLQAGVGFDVAMGRKVYFRLEGLCQLRFIGGTLEEYFNTFMRTTSAKGNYSLYPGIGPVLKAGFGFKLY
jgi:hypothetical protein